MIIYKRVKSLSGLIYCLADKLPMLPYSINSDDRVLYRLPTKSVRWKKVSDRTRWTMEICEGMILDKKLFCEECSVLCQRQSSILGYLPELPGDSDTRREGVIHTKREKTTEAIFRLAFSYFCTWVVLFSFLQCHKAYLDNLKDSFAIFINNRRTPWGVVILCYWIISKTMWLTGLDPLFCPMSLKI